MAKAHSKPSPDRFQVGQVVAFVLDRDTGHAQFNGALTTVRAARRLGAWSCHDPARPDRGRAVCTEARYTVDSPYGGPWHVAEYMLRAIYEGEPLSTWAALEQSTGLRLDAPPATLREWPAPRRARVA